MGLALPAGQDADAQGVSVRHGYTYTRMICQEWGRQPGWHNVRDPIPGSDWRNDDGWAIILVRGSTFVAAEYTIGGPTYNNLGQPRNDAGVTATGGNGNSQLSLNGIPSNRNSQPGAYWEINPARANYLSLPSYPYNLDGILVGTYISDPDYNTAPYPNGVKGWVTDYGRTIVVDHNQDGLLTTADTAQGIGSVSNFWYYRKMNYERTQEGVNYGASYIRWANMRYCR